MNARILLVAGFVAAAAPSVSRAQQAEVVVAPVVVNGEVIRYEPGRTIVVKADGREQTYVLTPELTLPADVQLGRRVSVYTERGADGTSRVTRVVSTSVTPDGQVKRTTEETRVGESGTVVREKHTTLTGEVVSFVPGKTIVVRPATGEPVSMALAASATGDVQVGQRVTLFTEPGADGATTVSRITTTAVTPEGQTKRTTEETRTTASGETTKTTTVAVQGTVKTYLPGKSLTLLKSDGTPVTYTIAQGAAMPAELAVGKVVSVRSMPGGQMQIVVEKQ